MASAYETYLNRLKSKQYAGSSGYWADLGTLDTQNQGLRSGLGYPGDRAKNTIASSLGLSPTEVGTSEESWGTTGNNAYISNDGIAYVGGSNTKFNGKDRLTGKMYRDGVELTLVPGSSTEYINPNSAERYKAERLVTNPTADKQVDDLMAQFEKHAADSITPYTDMAKAGSEYNVSSAKLIADSKAAGDTTGAQNKLDAAQKRYDTGLTGDMDEYRAAEEAQAAKQREIMARRYSDEANFNALNDQANNLAQAGVTKMVSRYGLGKNAAAGGANLGLGSDETALLGRESYAASLPYMMAKEKYHQENLANEQGVERDLYGNVVNRIGYNTGAQGQQYQSSQATAQAIQALKQAAVGQDSQTVQYILSQPTMLNTATRQAIAGDADLIAMFAKLKAETGKDYIRDVLGVNVSQPQYFSQSTPGYPAAQSPQVYGPNYPTSTGNNGGGVSPVTGNNRETVYDPRDGSTRYKGTNELAPGAGGYIQTPYANPYRGAANSVFPGQNSGAQSDSVYDQRTGTIRDRYGNITTNNYDRGATWPDEYQGNTNPADSYEPAYENKTYPRWENGRLIYSDPNAD